MTTETNVWTASRILVWIFVLAITASLSAATVRYIRDRDYVVTAKAPCDPEAESCFARDCDPAEEDPRCGVEELASYKFVSKKAYNFPPEACTEGEADCQEFLCSTENQELFGVTDECI